MSLSRRGEGRGEEGRGGEGRRGEGRGEEGSTALEVGIGSSCRHGSQVLWVWRWFVHGWEQDPITRMFNQGSREVSPHTLHEDSVQILWKGSRV
jgi:hypothetical protein